MLLRKLTDHNYIHECPPLNLVLSQFNLVPIVMRKSADSGCNVLSTSTVTAIVKVCGNGVSDALAVGAIFLCDMSMEVRKAAEIETVVLFLMTLHTSSVACDSLFRRPAQGC
jgi:hypothetical protein